jgi:hypothetical protein
MLTAYGIEFEMSSHTNSTEYVPGSLIKIRPDSPLMVNTSADVVWTTVSFHQPTTLVAEYTVRCIDQDLRLGI